MKKNFYASRLPYQQDLFPLSVVTKAIGFTWQVTLFSVFLCMLLNYLPVQAQQSSTSSIPSKMWDQTLGGNQADYLSTMLRTTDGGYLLSGYSASGISGDKTQASRGGHDYWLVKTDRNGQKQWDKRYGGSKDDILTSVVQSADGGYLLGGYSASGIGGESTQVNRGELDYWVVKIDSMGNKLWDRHFGGNGTDILRSVIQTEDAGFLLAGNSSSDRSGDKTQAGRGAEDYWVVKIDSTGTMQWNIRYGGSEADFLSSVIAVNNGYLLAGTSYSGIGGDKSEDSRQGWDYWVIKIDSNGHKLWDRRFGGSQSDFPAQVIQTSDGNYLIAGISNSAMGGDKTQNSHGGWDYWLVKTDTTGNKLWDKRFGGMLNDDLNVVAEDKDGHYLLGGSSDSEIGADKTVKNQGGNDYWLVKVSKDGMKLWDIAFGGTADDQLFGLAQTGTGSYVLAGHSTSPKSEHKSQEGNGNYDYWLVTTTPETTIPPLMKVNFGDKNTQAPLGWVQDYGLPFGRKQQAKEEETWFYGWKRKQDGLPVDLSVGGPFPGNGRQRPLPADSLLAGLMHMQGNDVLNFKGTPVEAYWEVALENGEYQVTVSVGDGSVWYFNEEYHSINVEGVQVINRFLPTGPAGSVSRFKQAAVQVTVTDGLLTIDADGGQNTKINYVIIQPLSTKRSPANTNALASAIETTFKAYPNPFTDRLTLELEGWQGEVTLTLQDLVGNTLLESTKEVKNQLLEIDVTGLPLLKGVYLLKIMDKQGKSSSIKVFKN